MPEDKGRHVGEWSVAGLLIAGGIGVIAYEVLTRSRMEQTAALFIGLPALVAVIVALSHMTSKARRISMRQRVAAGVVVLFATCVMLAHVLLLHQLQPAVLISIGVPAAAAVLMLLTMRPRSVTAAIMVVITVLLLLSGMFLGEGFICILMAAPIFYVLGAVIGVAVDASRKKDKQVRTMCIIVLALIPLGSEGVTDVLSFPRDEVVVREQVVPVCYAQVTDNLSHPPDIRLPLPFYLRLGFPAPTAASGDGLTTGNQRRIHFAGGEGDPGDLVMQVEESSRGYIRFRNISDHSKITHWLQWQDAEVRWEAAGVSATRVRWTLRYRRLLDPAWYFRPWEQYAVRLATDYLIQANAARSSVR
jgi:hypothetical protein